MSLVNVRSRNWSQWLQDQLQHECCRHKCREHSTPPLSPLYFGSGTNFSDVPKIGIIDKCGPDTSFNAQGSVQAMRFARRYLAGVSQEGVPTARREWVLPVDAHQLLYTPIELVLVLILAHQARVANMSTKRARVPGHLATSKSTGSRFEGIVLSAMKQTPSTEIDSIKQPTPSLANANVASVACSNRCGLARGADSFLGHHTIDIANGIDQAPHDKASGSMPLHDVAAAQGEPEVVEVPPIGRRHLMSQPRREMRNRPMTPPIMEHVKSWLKQHAELSKFTTKWQKVRPAPVSPTMTLKGHCPVSQCSHWGGGACEVVLGTAVKGLAMWDMIAWWPWAWLQGALITPTLGVSMPRPGMKPQRAPLHGLECQGSMRRARQG
jgi:hypothetical protein